MGVPAHTTGSSAVRQETARSGEQTPGKPISSWQTSGAFLDISAPVPKIPNKAVVGIGKTLLPESDTVPAQLRGCRITPEPEQQKCLGHTNHAEVSQPWCESPTVLSPLFQPGLQLHTKRCSFFMSSNREKHVAREKNSWSRTSCGPGLLNFFPGLRVLKKFPSHPQTDHFFFLPLVLACFGFEGCQKGKMQWEGLG